jgi:hypothetical protein
MPVTACSYERIDEFGVISLSGGRKKEKEKEKEEGRFEEEENRSWVYYAKASATDGEMVFCV